MKPKLREIANLRATEITCESDKLHFVYIGRRDSYIQVGQFCGPVRIYRVDRFVIQFVYIRWKDLWSNSYIQGGQICGPIRICRVDRFVVQFVYTEWTDL